MEGEVEAIGNLDGLSGLQTNPRVLEEEALHEDFHKDHIEGRLLSKDENADMLGYSGYAQVWGFASFGTLSDQAPVLETGDSTQSL